MDENRDEIRLSAGIVQQFGGRFVLASETDPDQPGLRTVDVAATNERVGLDGKQLRSFVSVRPNDPNINSLDGLVSETDRLPASRIAIVLLCGGLSFRSKGLIHPLLEVRNPRSNRTTTLLDLQLDRIGKSPLKDAELLIVGTPLNEEDLRAHLARYPSELRPRLIIGGMAARLLPRQKANGPPLELRDESGRVTYNPIGHFEALRWLVLTGLVGKLREVDVFLVASYSNWGNNLTDGTLAIAGQVVHLARERREFLLCAEVTRRPKEKRSGSMLVRGTDEQRDYRLVKYSYGRGTPQLPTGASVLMSTNMLYLSRRNLLERLVQCASRFGLSNDRDVLNLLEAAGRGESRELAAELFDAAFPVQPHLIPVQEDGALSFLRVERDLDQLTLLSGPSMLIPIQVPPERGVSIKVPQDLESPSKRRLLFGS